MYQTLQGDMEQMLCIRRPLVTALAGSALLACLMAETALAQGTPWIAEPGTGTINLSYVNQNAAEFYRQTTQVKGPLEATGAHLSQNTVWIGVNYALTDAVALDVQSGWARSFVPGPVGPTPEESLSGLVDSNIAVTWRLVDELVGNALSVALRGAVIAAGRYDTGYFNSIGDGGSGAEASIIAGRFARRFGFSTELGYRYRTSELDIPADIFANLAAFIPVGEVVTLSVDYRLVNATSGIDIGGPGFSPSRFPELQEDRHIVGGRLLANVTDVVSVNGFFGQVVAGRNTAASRIFGFGLSIAFDTF